MNHQPVQLSKAREEKEVSFLEALSFESKDPLGLTSKDPLELISKEELGLKPSKSVTIIDRPQVPLKTKASAKMATSKAQTQCIELCHKTTGLIDHISIRILEYLTSTKHLQTGFETLAHDFLDICQILFSIEAGLGEYNRTAQKFPSELITELGQKFRVTQADFHMLDQMLSRLLVPTNRISRGLGKIFGDNDSRKMSAALAKTRESLRMSSLVFKWSLGSEKVEREYGIGYTALAAALNRMDHKAGKVQNRTVNGSETNHQPPAAVPSPVQAGIVGNGVSNGIAFQEKQHAPLPLPGGIDSQHNYNQAPPVTALGMYDTQHISQQLQQFPQPPLGAIENHHVFQQQQQPVVWSNRSSSIHREGSLSGVTVSPDLRLQHSEHIPIFANSTRSLEKQYSMTSDTFDRHSNAGDHTSVTGITEPESLLEDISALELGPDKVVRHKVDPASMPRAYPRYTTDSDTDTAKLRNALIAAIRGKDRRLVEQLLNRIPANTGANLHALKEAVLAHDEGCVRLLLLYGADPNDPDREGITPLFASVQGSFLAGATVLLKYGADPNLVAGPDLESPLAAAVMANMVGFSHLLLTYNGDPNHLTANGNTLLISAIKKKTPKKFIELLLDYGSDPNAKSRDGRTALFEAIGVGRADIVKSLLEHGADANLPGPKHMLWPATYQSPCLQILLSHKADPKKAPGIMELAASINNIESVRILLKAGVNPNIKKDGVYTPLCTAIRDDRGDLVRLLLANGADPNVPASEYPAFKCITHNRVHFLPLLVTAGANLHQPKGIVETAVSSNNMEALNWLLDQGLNPNDKGPKGMSPLTTAIREGRSEMVEMLLLRGADPHLRGEDWPVCMAVHNPPILKRILSVLSEPQAFKGVMEKAVSANQLDSVKLLIAAGVSVEDRNGGVFSPLTTALRENHRDIVKYLVTDGGADVNAPGEHLPVVKALRRFHGEDTEMLELLLDHGADPNKIYRGWNGMMQAVENGDEDVLRLLVKRAGVDLEAKDELGNSVVEMAISRGWDEAVQILKDGDIRLRN